jgi:hypothetical protein
MGRFDGKCRRIGTFLGDRLSLDSILGDGYLTILVFNSGYFPYHFFL